MAKEKNYLAAYGSLRLNEYNYRYFKSIFKEDFTYVRSAEIEGYNLYSLGSYPCVIFDNENTAKLVVDIFECSDEVHALIKDMELGAGYFENKIMIDNYKCSLYVYKDSSIWQQAFLVESGNWSEYLKQDKPF